MGRKKDFTDKQKEEFALCMNCPIDTGCYEDFDADDSTDKGERLLAHRITATLRPCCPVATRGNKVKPFAPREIAIELASPVDGVDIAVIEKVTGAKRARIWRWVEHGILKAQKRISVNGKRKTRWIIMSGSPTNGKHS